MAVHSTTQIDELIETQERIFLERQPRSTELHKRAARSLAGGVTSSWQITRPQPVFLERGAGSKMYDVDGNEYVDLHGGYGAGLAGHAHPAIVAAVQRQVTRGTHFAQPGEDAIAVAENLSERFGLPLWRFTNSGTEATMDAVHLMRAVTGRDLVIKFEGAYHGHHDSVQVSVAPYPLDENPDETQLERDLGPATHPRQLPATPGIPAGITELTLVATFNDLDTVRGLLEEHEGKVAGLILEPIMMNAGIIEPEAGFLAGLKDLLHRHSALLTFDEVKTGLIAGPGGVTRLSGVSPDIVCLAKAIGGGLITGAVGGTQEVMEHVADGRYEMVGTFNGNPLSMAAARAMLEEVATEKAYEHIEELRTLVADSFTAIIEEHGLPAYIVTVGAKGCVTFSTTPVRNYRDFLAADDRFNHLHWLFQHNGGVFLPPWGKTEQWLMSVQHDVSDVERFVENFERFANAVASTAATQPAATAATQPATTRAEQPATTRATQPAQPGEGAST